MRLISLYNKVQYEPRMLHSTRNSCGTNMGLMSSFLIVEALISYTPFNSKLDLMKDSFVWDCIVSFAKI